MNETTAEASLQHFKQSVLNADEIKAEAIRLGFSACGLAPAEPVDKNHQTYYEEWIKQGAQGDMHYLENYTDKRFDPKLLVPGTKTIVSVALNYYPKSFMKSTEAQIAWYAYGKDYHDIMKEKLMKLMLYIKNRLQQHEDNIELGRAFCDTAPVMERYWAWRAGLGWIGKNHQLIVPKAGSTFFLGELFLVLPANQYDQPTKRHCGLCRKCLEACPTQALTEQKFDARRCLSYLTIENRNDIPQWAAANMGSCFYGCDRCQIVCPHMNFATPTTEERFYLSEELENMTKNQWLTLDVENYRRIFRGSAVKRAKYEGLMRNIHAIKTHLQHDKDEDS